MFVRNVPYQCPAARFAIYPFAELPVSHVRDLTRPVQSLVVRRIDDDVLFRGVEEPLHVRIEHFVFDEVVNNVE